LWRIAAVMPVDFGEHDHPAYVWKRLRHLGWRCEGPQGHTPLIANHDKHDRLSALAALTVSPKRQHLGLPLRVPPHPCQALEGADFRRALLPQLRGPLIGRWDGGPMHRGPAIEAVCQGHPRLPREACPAYAPAPGWNTVNGHLANSLRRDTRDLRRRLSATTRRVRRSQTKRRAFIRRVMLPSPP
jgi:hypothetical protein